MYHNALLPATTSLTAAVFFPFFPHILLEKTCEVSYGKTELLHLSFHGKQLKQWTVQYSADYFRLDSIGRTPAKRHLYACHLGAADAPKQLVLTASIHGREYINTTLLLDMLAYYLPRYNHRELPDTPCYRELWRDVCIIFFR